MEHYVKSKFKTSRYDAKCKIKANQCINHAKIISDNNIKTFILNLNNSKNRVCDVDKTLKLTRHLLCDNGRYLLMKGDHFLQEGIQDVSMTSHQIKVPGVSDDRFLLEIQLGQT